MIGVSFARLWFGRIDLVLLLKGWAGKPVRPINNIDVTIAIQIAGRDPFGVVPVGQLAALKSVKSKVLASGAVDCGKNKRKCQAISDGSPPTWPKMFHRSVPVAKIFPWYRGEC